MKFSYRYQQSIVHADWLAGQALVNRSLHGVSVLQAEAGELVFEMDGLQVQALVAKEGRKTWVHLDGRTYLLERVLEQALAAGLTEGDRILRAPMPGQVRQVLVEVGQEVKAGEVLVLLEAMKMEMRIQAPHSAKVALLAVSAGQNVEREQILVELEGEGR
jgi:biotin carboxyl carrier protein